ERVRVVDIGGPWSRELCAGTHVTSSSEIGMISLISEGSVGSTNRRVESLVGMEAFRNFAAERAIVQQLMNGLKAPRAELVTRVQDLGAQQRAAEKKISALETEKLRQGIPEILARAAPVGGVTAVLESVGSI